MRGGILLSIRGIRVSWTSIDKIREIGFEMTKKRSRKYPAKTITDADYVDDIAILANTPNQAETLLHSLERAAACIGLHVNSHKTEYMYYNQTGDISTLDGTSLKLVDKFTYLGSSVSSTENDIDTRLTKAWTAIDWLPIIWKSDPTDKMKRSFLQAAVVSILLYGCTTWTLTKRLEKKLDGNYTRMLRAILNKSWRQHPTRHQLYGHLPHITKTIQARRTRHAGHCWRSRDELISDVLLWTPTYGRAKAGRPARTYIQQLCEDTGCSPEDLQEAMTNREKWRDRVRDICTSDTTWWWWWWTFSRVLVRKSTQKFDWSSDSFNMISQSNTLPSTPLRLLEISLRYNHYMVTKQSSLFFFYFLYSLNGHIVLCFLHWWPQCTFIPFSISLILSKIARIPWQILLSTVVGSLLSGRFRSLGYHSKTLRFHQLSLDLPAEWYMHFRLSAISSFSQLCSAITLLWMFLGNDIPRMDFSMALCVITSLCSSFFAEVHVSFETSLKKKRCYWRNWHIGLCPAWPWVHLFIVVNAFHLDLIREISAPMSQHIFTIPSK